MVRFSQCRNCSLSELRCRDRSLALSLSATSTFSFVLRRAFPTLSFARRTTLRVSLPSKPRCEAPPSATRPAPVSRSTGHEPEDGGQGTREKAPRMHPRESPCPSSLSRRLGWRRWDRRRVVDHCWRNLLLSVSRRGSAQSGSAATQRKDFSSSTPCLFPCSRSPTSPTANSSATLPLTRIESFSRASENGSWTTEKISEVLTFSRDDVSKRCALTRSRVW